MRIANTSKNYNNQFLFWIGVTLIWAVSTLLDRVWWNNANLIPSWDQADYLNSALSNGRALGILNGGNWEGFKGLINHSSKIPPLASFINASIIAIAGEAPKEAAWSLSIWNGLLLLSVGGFANKLRGKKFGLLAVLFVSITPSLVALRQNYVLEMPVCATSMLALWQLCNWAEPSKGGKLNQACFAGISCSISLLIKQSSLLVIGPAIGWIVVLLNSQRIRVNQLMIFLGIIISSILPWFKQNWITVISGTNRAVISSAINEGDPSIFTLDNWLYYFKLLPSQLGLYFIIIGISGLILYVINLINKNGLRNLYKAKEWFNKKQMFNWRWLVINTILCWTLTTTVPNKDPRYITTLYPYLIIILTLGWLKWINQLNHNFNKFKKLTTGIFLLSILPLSIPIIEMNVVALETREYEWQISNILNEIKSNSKRDKKQTIIIVPSFKELNQHNLSYYGRMNGGHIIARQLGKHITDIASLAILEAFMGFQSARFTMDR